MSLDGPFIEAFPQHFTRKESGRQNWLITSISPTLDLNFQKCGHTFMLKKKRSEEDIISPMLFPEISNISYEGMNKAQSLPVNHAFRAE